jgi:hypothetical protein
VAEDWVGSVAYTAEVVHTVEVVAYTAEVVVHTDLEGTLAEAAYSDSGSGTDKD